MTAEISSVMDGETESEQAIRILGSLKGKDEWTEVWDTYHLIGDCLRQTEPLSPGFSSRLGERLAEEPTVLAPPRRRLPSVDHPLVALSAAASVAIITFTGWTAYQYADVQAQPVPQLAAAAQPVKMAASSGKQAAGFSHYLLAHHETSPVTGMEGVTPYIRTVADNQ
jgi:sigma-E factor negative regulatory protein RseA